MNQLLTVDHFRLTASRLQTAHDGGDHVLNPDFATQLKAIDFRDAAVLIGLRPYHDGPSIILTQRAAHLRKHAGQVAFPGGAIDAQDPSPEYAALREAQEEIGLDPNLVEPLGRLPDYLTSTGFRIKPVLAIVSCEASFAVNREEVDAVFEVPLAFLMDSDNYKRDSRVWQGVERHFYTMNYENRLIWGVTAGMLKIMQERFYA